MKFFAALKSAEFAQKLFSAIGLNLETLAQAGDENALKSHVENAVKGAKPDAALQEKVTTLEAALTSASAEHALTVTQNNVLTLALAAVGFKAPTVSSSLSETEQTAAFKAALENHIKVRASAQLAQSGHPALTEPVADAPVQTKTLSAFKALSPYDRMQFLKGGGKLTD